MSIIGNFYGRLAYFNHANGKIEKAKELYLKAFEKGATDAHVKNAYGVLLLKEGSFTSAKEIFTNLLESNLKHDIKQMCKLNLALCLWKLGNIDGAIELLWEVHKAFRNSKVYGSLGYLLIEKGDMEKAMKYNLEAMEYDDKDPIILDNMGQLHYRKGEMDKAEEYFKKAIECNPKQVDSLFYLGCIAVKRGNNEEGIQYFDQALACRFSALSTVSREMVEDAKRKLEETSSELS